MLKDSLIPNKTIAPSLNKIGSLNDEFYREMNTPEASARKLILFFKLSTSEYLLFKSIEIDTNINIPTSEAIKFDQYNKNKNNKIMTKIIAQCNFLKIQKLGFSIHLFVHKNWNSTDLT